MTSLAAVGEGIVPLPQPPLIPIMDEMKLFNDCITHASNSISGLADSK